MLGQPYPVEGLPLTKLYHKKMVSCCQHDKAALLLESTRLCYVWRFRLALASMASPTWPSNTIITQKSRLAVMGRLFLELLTGNPVI